MWYHKEITIDGKPVFLKKWYDAGISYIGHLLNDEGRLMSYAEFCEKYFIPMFTEFWGLHQAISIILRKLQFESHMSELSLPYCKDSWYHILTYKLNRKSVYNKLIEMLPVTSRYITKWNRDLRTQMEEADFYFAHMLVRLPQDPKLIWFQYKMIHRILGTKDFLCKME